MKVCEQRIDRSKHGARPQKEGGLAAPRLHAAIVPDTALKHAGRRSPDGHDPSAACPSACDRFRRRSGEREGLGVENTALELICAERTKGPGAHVKHDLGALDPALCERGQQRGELLAATCGPMMLAYEQAQWSNRVASRMGGVPR